MNRGGNMNPAVVFGGMFLALVGSVWGGAKIASLISGAPAPGANVGAWAMDAATGRWHWGAVATACTLALLLLVGMIAVVLLRHRKRHEHDLRRKAALLPRDAQGLRRYTTDPPAHLATWPGVPVGLILPGGRKMLRATWEDQLVEIAGPRTGKTSCRAIPAILEAPGAVLATSNKRDLVDATRGPRSETGPVWIFDPQGLAGGEPTWWWNPLSGVYDVRTARSLAAIWATVGRDFDARTDPYFHPEGRELLAMMLLAAGHAGRPVTDVYTWLLDPNDDTPRNLLHEHGEAMWETNLAAKQALPEKQRAGVYGTAAGFVSFLADPNVLAWVTDAEGFRGVFAPKMFASCGGTLYSISKEGEGSSAPLTTALTAAVLEAAEDLAAASPGGRLPTPLLGVLDEAANVCPLRELPNLVSHYGSRGIVLMVLLQSEAQGRGAWGKDGVAKLAGACNLRIMGGGSADADFLRSWSEMVGDWEAPRRSHHDSNTGRSHGTSWQRERIFDTAALGAMGKGEALVLISGARPVLVESRPWWEGPHAEAVRRSIARYDPGAPTAAGGAA